jgi:5-methylcytosine-specific restriction enzyme subunit McrC
VIDPHTFRDLSPYCGEITPEDDAWLQRVSELDPRTYRIALAAEDAGADEFSPLIERAHDGHWWAGRYIGAVSFEGRRLVIEPRFGIEVIEHWLDEAFGLIAPPASARHIETDSFVVRLLARIWCRSIDQATRHGLPLLRLAEHHEGLFVRGRLNPHRTAALQGQGRPAVASVTYGRSLAHPATRAIVCAERALATLLTGRVEWRTERVRQVMPHLRGGVGSRPKLPTANELERVRYTPITLPFKRAAELSHRIASRLGYGAAEVDGQNDGMLIDVAELWELFVLNCARQVAPPGLRVEHGTTASRHESLLRSQRGDHPLGRLKPDVLVLEGDTVRSVIDAKYKRLADTRQRPTGVAPADLYQIVAYALRFNPSNCALLAYPAPDPQDDDEMSYAEQFGAWECDGRAVAFERFPTDGAGCRAALTRHLTSTTHSLDSGLPAPHRDALVS